MGVTGYAGAELARLLLHHPRLKGTPPVFAGRVDEKDAARGGVPLTEIHPQLADSHGSGIAEGASRFRGSCLRSAASRCCFWRLRMSSRASGCRRRWSAALRVIDLSGAWRLREAANRAVYKFEDEGSP